MNPLHPPQSPKQFPKQQAKGAHSQQHSPFQQRSTPQVAQRRIISSSVTKRPVAPPVYRPQAAPRVLQTKLHVAQLRSDSSKRVPVVPPINRPQSAPKVRHTRMTAITAPSQVPRPLARQQTTIQRAVAPPTPKPKIKIPRPSFTAGTYRAGAEAHNLHRGANVDPDDPQMQARNVALPHRISWKYMKDRTLDFLEGTDDADDFERWTNRMLDAGKKKLAKLRKDYNKSSAQEQQLSRSIQEKIEYQIVRVTALRNVLVLAHNNNTIKFAQISEFLTAINSFIPNVYGWGPHSGVNTRVQENMHSNFDNGSATPMTGAAYNMTPGPGTAIAMTPLGGHIVGTSGNATHPTALTPTTRAGFERHEHKATNADTSTKWGSK